MATDYPKFLYENRLDDATPVASTTAAGDYNVLNLRDFRPYTWWKPTALPATVTVDCGSAKAVDYWAVYGHDLFTAGCTIELRGSTDNFSASDVLVDSVTPADNKAFARYVASVSYRYWRLRITGAATMPALAIAALGVLLDVPSYLTEGFDPIGRKVIGVSNRSMDGHPLGRTVKYEQWEESLNFQLLTWGWLRSSFQVAWVAHLRDDPFLFVWDPAGHPAELYLVSVKDLFKSPHRAGSYCNLALDVVAVVQN
jgi:hypothetical protein